MSDYISKSALIEALENECKGQLIGNENVTLISFGDVIDLVFEQPTLSETEIIRNAFERVVERLEAEMATENFKALKNVNETYIKGCIDNRVFAYSRAIKIVKEEC